MNRYYVDFVDQFGQSYTVAVDSSAPRKAVRKARHKMAKSGIDRLHCREVSAYYDTGRVTPEGLVRVGIKRFANPWKW